MAETSAANSFETQLDELESVVARLEEGNLPLEQTVSLFERGVVLTHSCRAVLASAESRVEAVVSPEDEGPVRTQAVVIAVDEEDEPDLERDAEME